MDGICVEDCKLLLINRDEKMDAKQRNFFKGNSVRIGTQEQTICFEEYVSMAIIHAEPYNDEFYWIKKSDRDKFFKRAAEEVVQCKSFGLPDEMNEFLRTIDTDKIVSCGCSHTDDAPCYWVYYKTFVEKGWNE